MKNRELKIRLISKQGQMMIEYVLMFSVIVLVMIFAAMQFIRPSVNHLFEETGDVISGIAGDFVNGTYTWDNTATTTPTTGGGGEDEDGDVDTDPDLPYAM